MFREWLTTPGYPWYIFFLGTFVSSLLLTPFVRFLAFRYGWIAHPVKDRWHQKPTALMGGVAIYLSIAIPLAALADFSGVLPAIKSTSYLTSPPSLDAAILIGATMLFLLGLIDDLIQIKPYTKLVGQILTASLMTLMGFRLHWCESMTLDTLITLIWIVGVTNAFNLIDNMDGLCAGVAVIAAGYFFLLFSGHDPDAAIVAILAAGAFAGFLVYNFNPASIFMGDCGSLVIGFTLAMMAVQIAGDVTANAVSPYTVPVMVLMAPILDTTLVTFIRFLSGRKASIGGRDHTSHRLVLIGFGEKGAVLFLYGVGAVSGLSAMFVSRSDALTSPVFIIPLAVALLLMAVYLAQLRIYPEKEFSRLRGKLYTPVLIELTYKRQIVLIILDFGLIAFAYYLSYRLRFDAEDFPYYFTIFLNSLPAVIACKFVAFYTIGIYRGFWRYLSSSDVFVFLKASFFGSLLSVVMVTFIYRFEDFSKGIFLIDWLLTTGLLLGARGSFRMSLDAMRRKTLIGENVLIYGAGRGGEILLRELLNNKRREIKPVGFIDDNPVKTGKKIQGYPILGGFRNIDEITAKTQVSGLLISFHKDDNGRIDDIKRYCKTRGLFLKRFAINLTDVDLENTRN